MMDIAMLDDICLVCGELIDKSMLLVNPPILRFKCNNYGWIKEIEGVNL